ncbi:MAG: ABC transporter substrate-binding protein [Oscillospiraceae bacterium]|nr:ABC transporter substrate-binding protein [Oscillospiraceae bacterium]
MKKLSSILLLFAMLFSMAACTSKDTTSADETETETETEAAAETTTAEAEETAEAGDPQDSEYILRIGTTETSQSYSPWDIQTLYGYLAYETLTYNTEDGGQEMWLAEYVEWIDDTTLQIKLRDGIYFSNGEQMNGEDVIYSFYIQATSASSQYVDKLTCIDFDASYVEDDGLTVNLVLYEVNAVLDSMLPKIPLTDKSEASDRTENDSAWWDNPITSSAYEIVENVDGSHVTFRLREDYWDTENTPLWDEITCYYYSNATSMFIAFENNELDIVLQPEYNDFERALSGDVTSPDTTSTLQVSTRNAQLLIMSEYKEEFQDPKVREAVAHALNADDIATVRYGTLYKAGLDSVLSSSFDAYVSQGTYEYNVEYAKQCMAESNYPDGFDITVVSDSGSTTIWEVVQAQLAEIGINVTIETYDYATMISKYMEEGGTDMAMMGGDITSYNPYDTLNTYNDSATLAILRILDEGYNALYDAIASTVDEDARNEIYAEMQAWFYENCWIIPLYEPELGIVYNNSVLECSLLDLTCDRLQYACTPVTD